MAEQFSAEQLLQIAKAEDKDAAVAALNEAAPTEEGPVAPPETKAEIHTCPRCAFRLKDKDGNPVPKVEANEEEKREYIRRMLAGERYTKTFSIYDGRINLTFTTLSGRTSKNLNRVLQQITLDEAMREDPKATAYGLKMMAALTRLEVGDNTYNYTLDIDPEMKLETAKAKYEERFGDFDEWLLVAIITAFGCFERLLQLLMEDGFSENFWKGAGLS
jgi:hypothetical protein